MPGMRMAIRKKPRPRVTSVVMAAMSTGINRPISSDQNTYCPEFASAVRKCGWFKTTLKLSRPEKDTMLYPLVLENASWIEPSKGQME